MGRVLGVSSSCHDLNFMDARALLKPQLRWQFTTQVCDRHFNDYYTMLVLFAVCVQCSVFHVGCGLGAFSPAHLLKGTPGPIVWLCFV